MPLTTPPILVRISPERIRIGDGSEEWSYSPTAWVDPRTGKVAGIGDEVIPGSERVLLFGTATHPAGSDRQALLSGFFFRALDIPVRKAWLKVKPKVTVEGIDTLSTILGGYERSIIEAALKRAGAMAVAFM